MAIMKQALQTMIEKLDDQYRSARESLCIRGEDTAQNVAYMDRKYIAKLDELRRSYDVSNSEIYGMSMLDPRQMYGVNAGGGNLGAAQNQLAIANNAMIQNALMGQQQPAMGTVVKPAAEKEGVLFFRGAELPEVWMGAHYDSYQRAVVGKQWKISYSSKFSSDTIMLWLSSEQFSGQDADKVARTYLETINQRRLG